MPRKIALFIICCLPGFGMAQSSGGLDTEQQIWVDEIAAVQNESSLFTAEFSYRFALNYDWTQTLTRVRYGIVNSSESRFDLGLALVNSGTSLFNINIWEIRPYVGWNQRLFERGRFHVTVYLRNEFFIFPEFGFDQYLDRIRVRPQVTYVLPVGRDEGNRILLFGADVEYLNSLRLTNLESVLVSIRYRARVQYDFTNTLGVEVSYFYENAPVLGLPLRHSYRFAFVQKF